MVDDFMADKNKGFKETSNQCIERYIFLALQLLSSDIK